MSDPFEVTDLGEVEELLAAATAGASHVRLDVEVEQLVARALEGRAWSQLRAASIALRIVERAAREDGVPVPVRCRELLAQVRAAERARRSARSPA